MKNSTTVWAVAAYGIHDGWNAGTVEMDGETYADVYATRNAAEKELADIILERLRQFIDGEGAVESLSDALDSGFAVVPAQMRSDRMVVLEGEELGLAPPDIKRSDDELQKAVDAPRTDSFVQ